MIVENEQASRGLKDVSFTYNRNETPQANNPIAQPNIDAEVQQDLLD